MLVLAVWTDNATAAIPPGSRKSLSEIAAAAKASRSTVAKALDQLDREGWIRRKRPTEEQRRAGGKTGYRLLIPAAKKPDNVHPLVRETDYPGVVRETDYPPTGSPGDGLPATRQNKRGSPGDGLGVVRETDFKRVTKRTTKKTYGETFSRFWETYPRHVGKLAAERAFDKACKRASAEEIILGAKRLSEDPNLPDPKFIPHPTTWLNRGGWLDDPLPPLAVPSVAAGPGDDGWVPPVSPFRGMT